MAVQFAGSSSTGSRRRRRLVVNGDDPGVDARMLEGDGGEIASQLIASEAAAPWVPVTELRIGIYTALVAVMTAVLAVPVFYDLPLPTALKPIKDLFLTRTSPKLIDAANVMFLLLATQLALLIGWYRSRGKLDFGGRYRVWPWAVALFAIVTLGWATDLHRAIGQIAEQGHWFNWRNLSLGWLVPLAIAALPIAFFLDRDLRNSNASLWLFRSSSLLWLAAAALELFQPELHSQVWFEPSFLLLPLFASATLFLSLWHQARIVAYVCPDPPELSGQSLWSRLSASLKRVAGMLMFWKRAESTDEEKPKRRRKKAEGEEAVAKRKRKAPARRKTTRTKTRVDSVEEEEAENADADEVAEEESEEVEESTTESSWTDAEEENIEEVEESRNSRSRSGASSASDRVNYVDKTHGSSVPAPHSRRQSSAWEEEDQAEDASVESDESGEESDDDRQFSNSTDQMRGLSKRQRRELRKQIRDQERSRGR